MQVSTSTSARPTMLSSSIVLALSLAAAAMPAPLETSGSSVYLEPGESGSLASFVPVADASPSDPVIVTCQAANCSSGCLRWLATGLGMSNCYWAGAFTSVELIDPNRFFAPGVVDIAPDNCVNWVAIPQQGICYNIIGTTFHQFGTFDI
ncbi:hypothetical protein C8T65DRAFT_682094 [Cerioporus squamosus]|nr:hypothetical protein C8T65DRAFT_682094 [Cerioporus squamosus]